MNSAAWSQGHVTSCDVIGCVSPPELLLQHQQPVQRCAQRLLRGPGPRPGGRPERRRAAAGGRHPAGPAGLRGHAHRRRADHRLQCWGRSWTLTCAVLLAGVAGPRDDAGGERERAERHRGAAEVLRNTPTYRTHHHALWDETVVTRS